LTKIAELKKEIEDTEKVLKRLKQRSGALEKVAKIWNEISNDAQAVEMSIPLGPQYRYFVKEVEWIVAQRQVAYLNGTFDKALVVSRLLNPYKVGTNLEALPIDVSLRFEGKYTDLLMVLNDVNTLDRVMDIKSVNFTQGSKTVDSKDGIVMTIVGSVYYFGDKNELNKILKEEGQVKVIFTDNQVAFELNGTVIISRLIEGEFPNYEQVIPKEKKSEKNEKIKINKGKFLAAIKRASLFTSQDSQSIKIDVFKNKLVVSKMTPDIGEVKEDIAMDYNGNEITAGFNPWYLMDVLKNLEEETIDFELVNADKPGVFREDLVNENGFYVYIVLPMQLA